MSQDKEFELEELSEITPEAPEKNEKKRPAGAELFEWLQMVMVCVLGAVIAFNLVVRLSVVDGQSMDPTLEHGELMLVWSLGYTPKQGDVIIINKTPADFLHEQAIVKRVIALGGQSVDIDYEKSRVYVDGERLKENYILEEMYLPGNPYMRETHFEVPEGEVFVLGDNRNDSSDSRHRDLGPIDQRMILGKAVFLAVPGETAELSEREWSRIGLID